MNDVLLILALVGAASLIFSASWLIAGLVFDATVKMPDDFEDEEALSASIAEFERIRKAHEAMRRPSPLPLAGEGSAKRRVRARLRAIGPADPAALPPLADDPMTDETAP